MSEATMPKETKAPKTETVDIKAMNIFQRVAAITDELGVVAKNLSVKAGGGSYKAVSERDIIDAVKPLETKYGVYSYPSDRTILESETLENEKNYNGTVTKSTTFFTRVQTEYTFINIDKPEDRFTTIVFSEGIDPGDKGSGKAMTYADKYALMKAYKISTGDDPDQNPSEENNYTRTGAGQNQYRKNNQGQGYGNSGYQAYEPPRAPQDAPGIKIKCKNCGKLITETRRNDGTMMTATEVAYFSMQRFGMEYCASCQTQLQAIRNGQK